MPFAKAIDIETTVGAWYGRKASPYHPGNWIVAAAYVPATKLERGPVHGKYWTKPRASDGWLVPILAAGTADPLRFLAGFNIKFDLLHLLNDPANYEAWQQWVADGGLVWDCQLAEYLLEGMTQDNQTLALEDVSLRYGGTLKHDAVKDLWEAGVDTPDIPKDLLMRYLCGDAPDYDEPDRIDGDALNTVRIFKAQYLRAQKAGMLPLMRVNMGALIATIEMERNGLHVDKAKGEVLAQALAEKIVVLEKDLVQYLPKDLPFPFNWNSTRQKSALIFGGVVEYDRREYDLASGGTTFDPPTPETKDQYLYSQQELNHYVLENGETVGWPPGYEKSQPAEAYAYYKSGLKAGEVKTKKVKVNDYTKPKTRMARDTYEFPRQAEPKASWAGAEPGTYSTAAEVIEELALMSGLPFLSALDTLTKAIKDLGTYYITTDKDGKQKGMLTKVQPDGLIHHSLHMVRTVTARLSSADPNLQNLPRGDTSDVKQMFVSRFEDGASVSSDFTSLEVYCQAYLTGDRQLIADLIAGLDMHCARLSAVEHMDYDDVLVLCKVKKDPVWTVKRTHIKTYSFQRAYGAGADKIAAFLKVAVDEVKKWITADDARYPGIPVWQNDVMRQVQESKQPTGRFVLHPITKDNVRVWRGTYRDILGKVYVFDEVPAPEFAFKRDGKLMGFMPTETKNYPVQGFGGEVMKVAMWLTVRAFYKLKNFGGRGLLVNTVHDAQYADSAPEVKMKVAGLLHACMSEATAAMEREFGLALPLPVPSDTTAGPSMADEESLPGLEQEAARAQAWVRRTLNDNYVPTWERIK